MSKEEYYAQSLAIQRIGAKNVLNVEELSVMLDISANRVRHLTSSRAIPHYKCNGKLYFKKSEIEDWLTTHRVSTDAEITKNAVTQCATSRIWRQKLG